MTNLFFKPTLLYKEFLILDLIEKNKHITQRVLSENVGVAVSMINSYLDDFEEKGLIKRNRKTTKTVEYIVTKKGVQRRKLLNIRYLKSSQDVYASAKDNIAEYLNEIVQKGFSKILLYGAGEVAEIILDVLKRDSSIKLKTIAVIDDNIQKQGMNILDTEIISIEDISNYAFDGIFISSYTHHQNIYKKLISRGYKEKNILHFFD